MATEVYAVPEKFRDDFPTTDINAFWKVVAPPPGAGWSIDWATPSALRMIAGAGVGEMAIRSTRGFKAPFGVQWLPLLTALTSQRVANQEIILAVTTEDGRDVAAWVFSTTTQTTARMRCGNGGVMAPDSGDFGIPNSVTGSLAAELEVFPNEVWWHSRVADDASARATSQKRDRRVPDPNTILFIEMRMKNTAATTAGTVLALDGVTIQDINELPVEITGGRGGGGAAQGVPVVSAGGANLPTQVNGSVAMSTQGADNTINNAALAASATFTQTGGVDLGTGVGTRANRDRLVVKADAATLGGVATIWLEESLDATTWREVYRSPLPLDSSAHSFDVPVRTRYRRWKVTNGATAMTNLFIQSRVFQFDGPTDQHENLEIPLTPAAGVGLAISATFMGPTIDLGSNHMWDKARALASSDQTGSLFCQQSLDGLAWGVVEQVAGGQTIAASAGSWRNAEYQIVGRYLRFGVNNGATAATALRVVASLVSL